MEKVILNAEIREELGKARVKEVRRKDLIPAVVYRGGKEAFNIKVDYKDFLTVMRTSKGANVLITLKIKNDTKKKERICIVKEVQRDPVRESIMHIDLNEISLTEKIKVKVPIQTHGEAQGVVKDGGVLETVLWEIEVECLPTDIPEKISVEVSPLKIGDTIYVKNLIIPPNVKVLNDPELTVVNVKLPAKEEVVEVAPVEGEVAEPEVISKGKKEVEEEPAEGDAAKKEAPKKEAAPPKADTKEGKK